MSDDDNGIKLDFLDMFYPIISEVNGRKLLSDDNGVEILDYFDVDVSDKVRERFFGFNIEISLRSQHRIKNIRSYLDEMTNRIPYCEKYKDVFSAHNNFDEFKTFVYDSSTVTAETDDDGNEEEVSNTTTDDTTYVYDDVLASHDLSSETNEDKAIEILLKAITETIFMIMDDMFLYILNCERYINESASMSDEIPQDSLEKSRGIINRAKNRMYELAQMLIVSCPEQWKQEFNDKYIVLGNSEPDLDSIVFDS